MGMGRTWRAWAAIAVLAITGGAMIACKTSGRVEFEAELPGMHLSGGGRWTYRGEHGGCFEIKFYDGKGREVGSGLVRNGEGSGTVSPSAKTWTAKQIPCPDRGILGPAPGGTHEGKTASHLADVFVAGGPIGFDRASSSHNALYEFIVRCDPWTDEASRIAQQVIEAPLGAPIPGNVSVLFLAEAFQNATSGRIVCLAQRPFSDFRVDLNGDAGYADLSTGTNAVQSQVGPNLWTMTTDVSYADIHGYNQWNTVRIEQRVASQSGPTVAEYRMMIPN